MYKKFSLIVVIVLGSVFFSGEGVMVKAAETETAVLAGGCFWCLENDLAKVDGVVDAVSGYTGGSLKNPSYDEVTKQTTGHYEAVRVTYDPSVISYDKLLDVYWVNIDPFDSRGQFCDKGSSYKAAIFYLDDTQKKKAIASKAKVERELGNKVVTEILKAGTFYEAEDYHQDYAKKNPIRYKYYRYSCGRDSRLNTVWGDKAG